MYFNHLSQGGFTLFFLNLIIESGAKGYRKSDEANYYLLWLYIILYFFVKINYNLYNTNKKKLYTAKTHALI